MKHKLTSYKEIEILKERKREKVVLYEEVLTQDLDRMKHIVTSTVKDSMWGIIPKVAFMGAKSLIKSTLFRKR